MNIPENCYMPCPVWECNHQEWVSTEDPDASLGELWRHVSGHGYDQDTTSRLMGSIKLMDEDGNEVNP